MKILLEAKNKAQERIKEYLENNASEILANKINNGVKIQKDDKTLLNKKDLNGFMKFASDEASSSRGQPKSRQSFTFTVVLTSDIQQTHIKNEYRENNEFS